MIRKTQTRYSPYAIYIAGAVLLCYSFIFPFYRISDYFIGGIVTAFGYLIAVYALPKEKQTEEVIEPKQSEDAYCTMILSEMEVYMKQIQNLIPALEKPELQKQLTHILNISDQIRTLLVKSPQKSRKLRKFINVTYPTLLTILKSYDELENEHLDVAAFQERMDKVEQQMKQFETLFMEEYTSLFDDTLMDLDAELAVIEQMYPKGGLKEDGRNGNDRATEKSEVTDSGSDGAK